ncbi:MAG: succinate dehydrogenase assembly factor 2 [Xanthomonadales bacterium]|jgi:antitoxin CptB|nr:succinate dehydrogenase assembly factor 2 [Xanthomonadales bacterium]
MADPARIRKLRWLCRRGMKELDVLLLRFVERESAQLENGGWPEFEELLSAEDDRLWAWVQKPETLDQSAFRPLLDAIRS